MEAMAKLNCTLIEMTVGTSDQLAWNKSWCVNATHTETEISDIPTGSIPLGRIVFCSILFFIIIMTLLGNLVVLLAFKTLTANNHFNLYIINLALTDFLVAMMAMSFYTVDVLIGYWPFGEFMCGVWIFFDYGMTFASVFTLVAISADRYWSVAWALHYRNHNSKRKTLIAILIVWLAVLAVWLGPCISDRMRWSEPNVCIWEPSRNRAFVVFIAIIGHHTPCVVLVFCYIRVAKAMITQQKAMKSHARVAPQATSSVTTENDSSTVAGATDTGVADAKPAATSKSRDDKEKKIFITLSYVIISYLACWVPFHVVFDLSSVDPEWVPEPVYTTTFWLTYFNSTLNPFLYAYSSKEFRNAFKKVLQCQFT